VTRPARIALTVAVLAALQVGAIVIYRAVESGRAPRGEAARFEGERLRGTEQAPALDAARADGTSVTFVWPTDRVRVVHFWATWCKPCRTELPGLLALARDLRERGIELLAVAVDDTWADIEGFFDGAVPPEIVVARDPEVHKRFGVSTLPDTYVVDEDGRLVERFHGARDWRAATARSRLLTFLE